jgi:hypothetical protein
MLGVTLFGLFFTPVFYVVIRRLAGKDKPRVLPAAADTAPVAGEVEIARKVGSPTAVQAGLPGPEHP